MWDKGRQIKADLVDKELGLMERRAGRHLKVGKGQGYSNMMHISRFSLIFIYNFSVFQIIR